MAIERTEELRPTQEASKDLEKGLTFLANSGRPIPGQSLTSNPDEPRAFEKPTTHVELAPAIDALFLEMTEPEAHDALMKLMKDGLPIGDLTQLLLTDGFQKGMWNPDLMLLLIEPTMYMLMALAEKAGVDYKLYRGEENEPSDPEEQLAGLRRGMKFAKENFNIQAGAVPEEILEKIENRETQEQPSLLDRGVA